MQRRSLAAVAVSLGLSWGCGQTLETTVEVRPTREARTSEGELYNPSTQSLLRTHSWLEDAQSLELRLDASGNARLRLQERDGDAYLEIKNLPLEYLVPRLHYRAADPPDDFDALNLLLAEYSRNSISVPPGRPEDEISHYETNLTETVPWKLQGDFQFVPNRYYRPQRVSVVNNCLRPGLWELSANDRSGEIYHSWFDFPEGLYYELVARVNGLDEEFIKQAVQWREDDAVPLQLARLRQPRTDLGIVSISPVDEEVSFSSQDSRRKLHNDYVQYEAGSQLQSPRRLSDFFVHPVLMSSFVEPGIYSIEERMEFDFSFLANPRSARVWIVEPKTRYDFNRGGWRDGPRKEGSYIEIVIDLGDQERLIIGNLPLDLLVEQEDYPLHGFGVGILDAAGFAERRRFLIERGPHPSYAYLARQQGEELLGVNSHTRGIEQVFLRSHPNHDPPYWEVILTSYERIVDLVKYRIEIPESLWAQQKEASVRYIPPIFFNYRDDNVN